MVGPPPNAIKAPEILMPRIDRGRVEVDAAHHVRDLVAPPLAPQRIVLGGNRLERASVAPVEAFDAGLVVADVRPRGRRLRLAGDRELGVADAVEVEPVHVVALDQMGEDVHRVGGRVRVPEVEPELGTDAVALEGEHGSRRVVRKERPCEPVVAPRVGQPRPRHESMPVEGMVGEGRGRQDRRMAIPDRARDDERMHLDAGGVSLRDEVGQRIEVGRDRLGGGHDLGRPFPRVQVPRVAAPPHLREDRVRAGVLRVLHHRQDVAVIAEVGVEGIDPEGAVQGGGRVRGQSRERVAEGDGESEANHQASREGSAHGTPLSWSRAKL